MIIKKQSAQLLFILLFYIACNSNVKDASIETHSINKDSLTKGSYAYDVNFLKKHTGKIIELRNSEGNAKILLSAVYQGRVMTSTATGDSGISFGWINYSLIESGNKKKQFNPVGGEERFWMGPEGGQYSLYFKSGDSFNINHWQVPPVIDTLSYEVVQSDSSQATFAKKATLINYSGTKFNINIERKITLLTKDDAAHKLQASIPANINFVGFETDNKLSNTGNNNWIKEKGLLSIWLLGMFTPSDKTTVIIPFHSTAGSRSFITDNYFGIIPAERLQVKDSVIYFTCDGKYRSKIGISPVIAKSIAASFDFKKNVLTIIIPQVNKTKPYVNSKWEIQKEPYKGDVINSYNDGPLADGTQMGPFYEIESSSPALELKQGETGEYIQTTFHLQGDYNSLRQLAQQLLGVDLNSIKK